MPQLDPTILTNQIFWFFLFFFISYFIFIKYILPILSIITKFSKKELLYVLSNLQTINDEIITLNKEKNSFLFKYINILSLNKYLIRSRNLIFPIHKFEITKFFISKISK